MGDSLADIMARARAHLRRKEMKVGDAEMQMKAKRGLTLLQYRADTDKRIQAIEAALAGLTGALDDIRAEIASAKAEQAEKLENVEGGLVNCLGTAFSKISALEVEEKTDRRNIERNREKLADRIFGRDA